MVIIRVLHNKKEKAMQTTRSTKKRFVLAALAATLVILGVVFILEKTRVTNFITDPTYKPQQQGPTEAEKKLADSTAAKQKEEAIEAAKQNEQAVPAEVPSDTDTITLEATQSGDNVTIHNELKGQGYSSGSCKLVITNGSATTTQTAEIIYQPEYSMCAGFTVPVNAVGAGDWSIRLDVTPLNGQQLTKLATFRAK